MVPSVCALGYVGFGVSDAQHWHGFASGVLGLEADRSGADGSRWYRMDDRSCRIAVHPNGQDDLAYAGWEVAGPEALAALSERLTAAGYPTASAGDALCAERGVAGLISCLDPNGIRCEFFYGAQRAQRAFRSPRDIRGFVTGDGGLGHIVLAVDDAAQTLQFYRDVLGFRVSDYIEFERLPGMHARLTFLHCNSRHHSLAFVQTSAPRRLLHLMLELADIDDVGRTYSLCERENVPITMSLGRHSNDAMFSFYVASPSNFAIEYGYGGRIIDDAAWQIATYDRTSIWGHDRRAQPSSSMLKEG